MRPFNLEEAKAGKKVCTRDGRPAKFFGCVKDYYDNFIIVAKIGDGKLDACLHAYYENGKSYERGHNELDLMMEE